jgi:hypothetical protein
MNLEPIVKELHRQVVKLENWLRRLEDSLRDDETMPQATVKGRALTAGTGVWENLTVDELQDLVGSTDFTMAANTRIESAAIWANSDDGLELADNAGNLGMVVQDGGLIQAGSNTPLTGTLDTGQVQINRNANGTLLLHRETANIGGPTLEMLKRRSGWGIVSSGERVGTIGFSAADSVDAAPVAQIYAEVDGSPGSNDMPGRIVFATTADAANTVTESMRINALQNLIIADGKRIETDEVRARDSGGLALYEDSGLGLFIPDGGVTLAGTTTPLTGSLGASQVEIDKAGNGTLLLHRETADTGGATLELLKRRSGWGVVSSGDRVGTIGFGAADSVDAAPVAHIYAEVDGSPGSNDMPGRLVFATTADAANTVTESMRINSSQNIIVADGKRIETDQVRARDSGGLALYDDAGVGIFVEDGGQVGIANNAPAAALHVGAGADTPTTTATIYASEAGATHIVARNSTDDIEARLSTGASSALVGSVTNHDLLFATNNAEVARFSTGGRLGIADTSPDGMIDAVQASTTAAIPVLEIEQLDLSEEMINFVAAIAIGNPIETVGAKTLTTTHFIRIGLNGSFRYIPVGTIA